MFCERWGRALLVVVLVASVAAFAGCGKRQASEKTAENMMERTLEKATGEKTSVSKGVAADSVIVGGINILIPPPTAHFVEVGEEKRDLWQVLTPTTNRLVRVFVLSEERPRLNGDNPLSAISVSGVVNTLRGGEAEDWTTNEFLEFVKSCQEAIGDTATLNVYSKELEDELNRRITALGSDSLVVFGGMTPLGRFFSKEDAYGFGLIVRGEGGGKASESAVGATAVRVRNRLLLLYLSADYQGEETVRWLRSATEAWSDEVQKANASRPQSSQQR